MIKRRYIVFIVFIIIFAALSCVNENEVKQHYETIHNESILIDSMQTAYKSVKDSLNKAWEDSVGKRKVRKLIRHKKESRIKIDTILTKDYRCLTRCRDAFYDGEKSIYFTPCASKCFTHEIRKKRIDKNAWIDTIWTDGFKTKYDRLWARNESTKNKIQGMKISKWSGHYLEDLNKESFESIRTIDKNAKLDGRIFYLPLATIFLILMEFFLYEISNKTINSFVKYFSIIMAITYILAFFFCIGLGYTDHATLTSSIVFWGSPLYIPFLIIEGSELKWKEIFKIIAATTVAFIIVIIRTCIILSIISACHYFLKMIL